MIIHKINNDIRVDLDAGTVLIKDLTGNHGTTSYIKDEDNTYQPVLNTTGYGGTNDTRDSISLLLLAYIKGTKADIQLAVVPYDPATVEQFEVKYTVDGWYNYKLIAVPTTITPLAANFLEDDVVWDKDSARLLKKIGGEWVIIDAWSLRNTSHVKASSDMPFVINSTIAKGRLNMKLENLYFHEDTAAHILRETKDDYDTLRALIEAACRNYGAGHKFVFQKMMEHITHNHCK